MAPALLATPPRIAMLDRSCLVSTARNANQFGARIQAENLRTSDARRMHGQGGGKPPRSSQKPVVTR